MIELYDAISPLLILGAFLAGRWTGSRAKVSQAKPDPDRFWMRDSLTLSPEQAARDGGA